MHDKATIRLDLTPAQQEQLARAAGRPVTALEIALEGFEQLEERVAPRLMLNKANLSWDT